MTEERRICSPSLREELTRRLKSVQGGVGQMGGLPWRVLGFEPGTNYAWLAGSVRLESDGIELMRRCVDEATKTTGFLIHWVLGQYLPYACAYWAGNGEVVVQRYISPEEAQRETIQHGGAGDPGPGANDSGALTDGLPPC